MAALTLSELIASLPEEERAILAMHYQRGLGTGEIANMLNVPERAVISVVATAKIRLLSAVISDS